MRAWFSRLVWLQMHIYVRGIDRVENRLIDPFMPVAHKNAPTMIVTKAINFYKIFEGEMCFRTNPKTT